MWTTSSLIWFHHRHISILSWSKQSLGPSLVSTAGDGALISDGTSDDLWAAAIVLVKQHTVAQFPRLFQCCSTFSNQISVVGSCNSAAMFKIQFIQNPRIHCRLPLPCDSIWKVEKWLCFQAIPCNLLSESKWWSQISSTVINLEVRCPDFH